MANRTDRAAAIYREAARILAQGESDDTIPGACTAIAKALHPRLSRSEAWSRAQHSDAVHGFESLFCPFHIADGEYKGYWGREWGDNAEQRQCRVLALCFAAAVVERA